MPRKGFGELLDILGTRRAAGSRGDELIRDRYLMTLPGAYLDMFGNIHVEIGGSPGILWSSHTDTVHTTSRDPDDIRQTLHFDPRFDTLELSKRSRQRHGNVLGADDGAGLWIMRQMILAGVPGYYIFHYCEEKGAIGSGDLARQCPKWLRESFRFAIAFDRRGHEDIITHQGTRTCSDAFALSLAAQLNRVDGLAYQPSDRGLFTDTAEYAHLIPECSNVSVGYDGEHSRIEMLDVDHVYRLLAAVCQLDQTKLISVRDPNHDDEDHGYSMAGPHTRKGKPIGWRSLDFDPGPRADNRQVTTGEVARRYDGYEDDRHATDSHSAAAVNRAYADDPMRDDYDRLYLNAEYAELKWAIDHGLIPS